MAENNTSIDLTSPFRSRIAEAERLAEASAAAHAPAPAVPFHERAEFEAIYAKLRFVSLGISAMKGIGGMMMTSSDQMDTLMNETADVFSFFGEALEGPAQEAFDTVERLQWAAKGDRP